MNQIEAMRKAIEEFYENGGMPKIVAPKNARGAQKPQMIKCQRVGFRGRKAFTLGIGANHVGALRPCGI